MPSCLSPEGLFLAKVKMHHKLFGGQALLRPAGRAYSTPTDPIAGLRV